MLRSFSLRLLAGIGLAIAIVLLVLMTSAGADAKGGRLVFESLLAANILIACILFVALISLLARIVRRARTKQYGYRMILRLAAIISLVGVVPCVLIFTISSHLVSEAFHTGVDPRVENALNSGVTLSSEMIKKMQSDALDHAWSVVGEVEGNDESRYTQVLQKETAAHAGKVIRVFDASESLVSASDDPPLRNKPFPERAQFEAVDREGSWNGLLGDPFDAVEGETAEPLLIEALVPFESGEQKKYYLQVLVEVPEALSADISRTVLGLRDYQEIIFVRSGMQGIYYWSLVVTAVLTVLGALLAATVFATQIIQPLRQLEEGTRQATNGKLQTIREYSGADEVNELTRAFNTMIRRINEAYQSLDDRRAAVEQTNLFLEKILSNLSTGVIVLDKERTIRIANAAAVNLLGPSLKTAGRNIADADPRLARLILPMLNEKDSVRHEGISFETPDRPEPLTLTLQTTPVPFEEGLGFIVMVSDMTQAVSAQRAIAWGEVARRLAHEIKNPLTPIQLAAERIQYKLEDELDEEHRALLNRHTKTIVEQVGIMNQMVKDFRDYARLPKPKFVDADLNAIIDEVAKFYEQKDFQIHLGLDENLPRIQADKGQLLQVLHNLLSNSREAARPDSICEVVMTTSYENGEVVLDVRDNGTGFTQTIMEKAFEPYVTTKATGTGLGLPMVKKIADEHKAKLTIGNDPETGGAVVEIRFTLLSPVREGAQEEKKD